MPKVSPIQNNFNAGEFSPLAVARVDADRYKAGLETCENYVPLNQGPVTRRPGTAFVAQTKFPNKKARLIPFEFSTTQAYIIEVGEGYFRFYRDEDLVTEADVTISGITKANPCVVTANAHGFLNGEYVRIVGVGGMGQVNNLQFVVRNATANTFELEDLYGNAVNSTAYGTYTSGGTVARIYEVSNSFTEAQVFDIQYTQSADVLYLVHPSFRPQKLLRRALTNWLLVDIAFGDGPYLPIDTRGITITPSAATGIGITLTASSAIFVSTDVGRYIRIKEGSTWGYVYISGFTSTTVVTANVLASLTNTAAKSTWRLGLWSDTTGYPSTLVFHEDRLWFAGTTNYPQRIDGSNSGDYENFQPSALDGTVIASHAISVTLNANDVNVIRWISTDEKGMPIGTVKGEWVLRPAAPNEALSSTNVSAKRSSSAGSKNVQPITVGKATLFVQRSGRKLMEMAYFYDVDGFRSSDMTEVAEHVSGTGIVQIALQTDPQNLIWACREDGQLIAMTYGRELDSLKVGWHRHPVGGFGDAAGNGAKVRSVAAIPSPDTARTDVWMIVERYIGGRTARYVEYMTKFFDRLDEQKDAFFCDAGATYDDPKTISAISKANPCQLTVTAHGFSNGDKVRLSGIVGMTELNNKVYKIKNVTTNTFTLGQYDGDDINSSAFNTYISGGYARKLVSSVTGLMHLEGETVGVLVDGASHPDVTVTNGAITLNPSREGATLQIGYRYKSRGKLLRIEAGAADGTAYGKKRRTHTTGFDLYQTLGFKFGVDGFDELSEATFRVPHDAMNTAPPLFTGMYQTELEADYNTENQICFQQDGMFPGTIRAITPHMFTQDRG